MTIDSSPHSLNVFLRNQKVFSIPENNVVTSTRRKFRSWISEIIALFWRPRCNYVPVSAVSDGSTLTYVVTMVEEGLIHPIVDRTFPLCDITKAHAYVETSHEGGKVVIVID